MTPVDLTKGAAGDAANAANRIIYFDFAFPPRHTRAFFDATGFRVLRALGDEGEFLYPNEHYRSYAMDLDLVGGTAEAPRVVCKAVHEERFI